MMQGDSYGLKNEIMQGDSYGLKIEILKADGTAVTTADVSDVEITIGLMSKTYSSGKVTFSEDYNKWIYPLTQAETFKFPAAIVKGQVRVVWADGSVEGAPLGEIRVHESISKEVL